MYAAALPIEPTYPVAGPRGLAWLSELMVRPSGRTVSATLGDVSVSLRR